MITSLILPLKIIIFNCFVTKQCIKSISSEATQSKQKWMESNGAPPQWFVVFVRLSLQVQKAAVRWQTISGSLMASVFAISTAAGPLGMGKWRTKKPCNLFHLLSLSTDMCVSLPASFPPLTQFSLSCFLLWWPSYMSSSFVMFLQPEAISTFTSEPALVSFAKFFCKTSEDSDYVS